MSLRIFCKSESIEKRLEEQMWEGKQKSLRADNRLVNAFLKSVRNDLARISTKHELL
jgi:hypothetical protein